MSGIKLENCLLLYYYVDLKSVETKKYLENLSHFMSKFIFRIESILCKPFLQRFINKCSYYLLSSFRRMRQTNKASEHCLLSREVYTAGFSKWDRHVSGAQNGHKLHQNYKINIFGGKQCWGYGGRGGGEANFFWQAIFPLLGETLHRTLRQYILTLLYFIYIMS